MRRAVTMVENLQRRRYRLAALAMVLACLTMASSANSQQLIVYPSQGQTPEQQTRDQAECHSWAVQQTGVDPASPPPPPSTAAPAPQGGVLRGAARGAVVGVTVGAITGDAGQGAAAGAPPEDCQRDGDPLQHGGQAGIYERNDRHDVPIGPALPDLDVQPLAEQRVGKAQNHGDGDDRPLARLRPGRLPCQEEGKHDRSQRDQDIAGRAV